MEVADAGLDAGVPENDAGFDAGIELDAGLDAGVDAGPERVAVFIAVGKQGRRIISCDDGLTWKNDVSFDDAWPADAVPITRRRQRYSGRMAWLGTASDCGWPIPATAACSPGAACRRGAASQPISYWGR